MIKNLKLLLVSILLFGCVLNSEEPSHFAKQSEELYKKAVYGYERELAKEPHNLTVSLELAKLYYSHNDYPQAIKLLERLDSQEAKKILAVCLYKTGDWTGALTIFERLGKVQDDEYLYYYGLTCAKHNLFEQAEDIFKEIKGKDYLAKAKERIAAIRGLTTGNLDQNILNLSADISQEKYPLAGAVVVLSDEQIKLTTDNTLVSTEHFIVKILNERGKKDFSEVVIGYDSTYESVEVEYAKTIKPSGEVIIVGEKDIRDVSRYLNFPLYSNARARIISMPEIVEGAIIEYKVKVTQSQLINKKDFNVAYTLEENEPIISAKFRVTVPNGRDLKIKVLNPEYNLKNFKLTPDMQENATEKTYSWEFKDIPQIEIEPSMPPRSEITPVILISTFNSWQDIYNWWWDLAKDRIIADDAISNKVKELTEGKKEIKEKIQAIYNYCAQEIRYVGIEYGQAGYQPHKAGEIFKNKYGDCKDKAILFITMLKAAGIEGSAVLIGTRGVPAMNEDFPAVLFNHCIAGVSLDGKIIFLDITAEACSFGDLPADDQDRYVLVFKKDKYEIINIPLFEPGHNRIGYKTKMNFSLDESFLAQRQVDTFGQFDQAQRYWLRYAPPNIIEQRLKENVQAIAVSGKLIKYNYENSDDLNLPIKLHYEFKGNNFLARGGEFRIFPQFFQLDTQVVAKDNRIYPLELGSPYINEANFEIILPKNLEVKYLTGNSDVQSQWLDYFINYYLAGNILKIHQKEVSKKRQVSKQEYPDFKKFLEDLAVKLDEHIILERR